MFRWDTSNNDNNNSNNNKNNKNIIGCYKKKNSNASDCNNNNDNNNDNNLDFDDHNDHYNDDTATIIINSQHNNSDNDDNDNKNHTLKMRLQRKQEKSKVYSTINVDDITIHHHNPSFREEGIIEATTASSSTTSSILTPVVWCILLTETAERFAYFGFRALLVFYLHDGLQYTETQSIALYAYTTAISYYTPLVGSILSSDEYYGLYKTILYFSIIYFIGLSFLTSAAYISVTTTTTTPLQQFFMNDTTTLTTTFQNSTTTDENLEIVNLDVDQDSISQVFFFLYFKRCISFIGLFFVCIGTGGIKPCVSAFGANQVLFHNSNNNSNTNTKRPETNIDTNKKNMYQDNDDQQRQQSFNCEPPNHDGTTTACKADTDTDTDSDDNSSIRLFFSYYYFCINLGAVASIAIVPFIRNYYDSFGYAFLIPTLCMFVSILLFISRQKEYIHTTTTNATNQNNNNRQPQPHHDHEQKQQHTTTSTTRPRIQDSHIIIIFQLVYHLFIQQMVHYNDSSSYCGWVTQKLFYGMEVIVYSFRKMYQSILSFVVSSRNEYDHVEILRESCDSITTNNTNGINLDDGVMNGWNGSLHSNNELANDVSNDNNMIRNNPNHHHHHHHFDHEVGNHHHKGGDERKMEYHEKTGQHQVEEQEEDCRTRTGSTASTGTALLYKERIHDAARILHILPIFATYPIYWCLYDQQGSVWTIQASKMYRPYGITPEQLLLINPIEIMFFLPLFGRLNIPPLRRMKWGMILAAIAFFISGIVESSIQNTESYDDMIQSTTTMNSTTTTTTMISSSMNHKGNEITLSSSSSVHVFWQIPQLTILAVGEIFVSVTGLEFAYSSSPPRLKSLLLGIYLLTTAIGDSIGGFLYSTIFATMNRAYVLHVCAILMLLNVVLLVRITNWYETTNYIDFLKYEVDFEEEKIQEQDQQQAATGISTTTILDTNRETTRRRSNDVDDDYDGNDNENHGFELQHRSRGTIT